MTIYVVPGKKGFWLEGSIPEGAEPISDELYQSLLTGECDGKSINWQSWPPSLKEFEFKADPTTERAWRDAALVKPCAVRDRHRDEQELFRPTSLTPERYVELLGYIQKLRDWPQSSAFPDTTQRPPVPVWLAEQN